MLFGNPNSAAGAAGNAGNKVVLMAIPLSAIKEQSGKPFVTYADAQLIFEAAFKSTNSDAFRDLQTQLSSSTTNALDPDGSAYRCKVWYHTMCSLAKTANPDKTSMTTAEVVKWAKEQIVDYLIKNNLVAKDLVTVPHGEPSEQALQILLSGRINVTVM